MHQKSLDSIDLFEGWIRQKLRPGFAAEALPDQEVAVAVHDAQPRAAPGQVAQQAGDDGIERLGKAVIADPVLEQVAEQVQRVGGASFAIEEGDQALVGFGTILAEVEIGGEQRAHYFPLTTVIDSMTTGERGTSRGKGPPGPVGVFAILVTTSIPETTLPNTA